MRLPGKCAISFAQIMPYISPILANPVEDILGNDISDDLIVMFHLIEVDHICTKISYVLNFGQTSKSRSVRNFSRPYCLLKVFLKTLFLKESILISSLFFASDFDRSSIISHFG